MNTELTLHEQLELLDPSKCDKQMSRHYKTYNTKKMVEMLLALTSKGEQVFELRQIQMKKSSKKTTALGRGVHVVKLKTIKPFDIGGEMQHPEIVIMNSYDGLSLLKIYCGIFRICCSNGLVIKTKDFGEARIRHMKTEEDIVMEIATGFAKNASKAINLQQRLVGTTLNPIQIQNFAKAAAKLRWDRIAEDCDFEDLIKVERVEDEGNDVWKVYNRIQEKLMKGGVKLEGMKRTAKPLTNAQKDIWVNEELFSLAMSYLPVDETLDANVEHFELVN